MVKIYCESHLSKWLYYLCVPEIGNKVKVNQQGILKKNTNTSSLLLYLQLLPFHLSHHFYVTFNYFITLLLHNCWGRDWAVKVRNILGILVIFIIEMECFFFDLFVGLNVNVVRCPWDDFASQMNTCSRSVQCYC